MLSRDAADGATAFWSTERGTDPYLLITHLSLPPALLNHNYSSPNPTPTVTSTSMRKRAREDGREEGEGSDKEERDREWCTVVHGCKQSRESVRELENKRNARML